MYWFQKDPRSHKFWNIIHSMHVARLLNTMHKTDHTGSQFFSMKKHEWDIKTKQNKSRGKKTRRSKKKLTTTKSRSSLRHGTLFQSIGIFTLLSKIGIHLLICYSFFFNCSSVSPVHASLIPLFVPFIWINIYLIFDALACVNCANLIL